METTKLFYRDGREFTGNRARIGYEKGKPYTEHVAKCSRCGGAGGADVWKHTGWTCYQCGGNGLGPVVIDKLYTQEQLTKLNAAQEKRNAKKAAAQAEAAAKLEAERNTNRADFQATHAAFFAQAATLNDEFVDKMIVQCIERVSISEKQIELINAKHAEAQRKAGSGHVGTVGARITLTCKVEKFMDWSNNSGYRRFTKYCFIMRDEHGNAIKYVGSSFLGGTKWEGEKYHGYNVADPTQTIKFKATVEEHTEYNGEKQTVVARPKLIEEPEPEGTKGGNNEPWL